MTIDIDPVLIHLGPIAISWYGIFVARALAGPHESARRDAIRHEAAHTGTRK